MSASFATRLVTVSAGLIGASTAYQYNQVLQRQGQLPKEPLKMPDGTPTTTPDVILVGGGVVGIATAYTCAQAGQKVLLLEPNKRSGQECSSCAAGGMQRSNPVVNRSTWMAVFKGSFLRQGYQFFHMDWFESLTDPFFLRWILTFSTTSLWPQPTHEAKQDEMLKFTHYCVDEMLKLMDDPTIRATGYNPTGSLSLSYTQASKIPTHPTASRMNQEPHRLLTTTEEIVALEPSIRFQEVPPQSAKYEYQSSAASAERFTLVLAERCAKHPNVTLLYGTAVRGMQVDPASKTGSDKNDKPRIAALHTNQGVLTVGPQTEVVVAAGAWTPHLLATCDLYAPVYPLKGYAISLSAKDMIRQSQGKLSAKDLPTRIVVVADPYMYTSRLGDEVRITSIGEFSGWSTKPTPQVDREFRREAAQQFPQLADYLPSATTRCGHRPYVNDGLLLLGRVQEYTNLLVSCGPGSNGWKMAMGSAEVVQRLTAGQSEEEIGAALGFDVSAFAPYERAAYSPWFAKLCRARWNV
jgi:D-amino-acid dehydrogenase